jgi:hypothetical protein
MSRSIPAGGQITPFDRASLSLSGPELPPPTVGGSPLTSGGHVTPCSGDVFSVGCASTTPACAKPTNAAMITMVSRKRQFLTHLRSVFVNVPRRNTFPPPTGGGSVRAFDVCAKKRLPSLGARRQYWREPDERRSLGAHDGWLDPNRRGITRGQQRYRGSRCGRWRRWYRRGPAAHGRAC